MAKYTENYKLIKPADYDNFDIANNNNNVDIIDTEIKKVNDKLISETNQTNKKITDIQIGGRNLIINHKSKMTSYFFEGSKGNVEFVEDNTTLSGYRYDVTITELATIKKVKCYFQPLYSAAFIKNNNKQYTISFKIKCSNNRTWNIYFQGINNSKTVSVTNEYQTVSITGNNTNIYNALYILNDASVQVGDVISFCDIKLEEGNQLTSWDPSVEYFESKILNLQNQIDNILKLLPQ